MDRINIRHDQPGWRRRQLWNDPLDNWEGCIFSKAADLGKGAICMVLGLIQGRHVNPVNFRQCLQQGRSWLIPCFPFLVGGDDFVDHLFALTDYEGIDECMHRFRVESCMSTGDDQRMGLVSLGSEERDTCQVQQVEGIGVKGFVGKRDAQDIKIFHRVPGLQRVERKFSSPERAFHVGPG